MKYGGHVKYSRARDILREVFWMGIYYGEWGKEFGIQLLGHEWHWELTWTQYKL
jgi:hypothetical protein